MMGKGYRYALVGPEWAPGGGVAEAWKLLFDTNAYLIFIQKTPLFPDH